MAIHGGDIAPGIAEPPEDAAIGECDRIRDRVEPRSKSGRVRYSPVGAEVALGGPSLAAPKGDRNVLKHSRCAAEAIARRREISVLIRVAAAVLILVKMRIAGVAGDLGVNTSN